MNDFFELYQLAKKGHRGCLFCDPFKGMSILETSNFHIFVDTFPIVPGHLMVSSKKHYGSAGELPNELLLELSNLKQLLQNTFQNKCIFYEHGRVGGCAPSKLQNAGCEHFHLHCIPCDICIVEKLRLRFKEYTLKKYQDVTAFFNLYGNYLYFENSVSEGKIYLTGDTEIAPHLLRSFICEALNCPHRANWKTYNEPNELLDSYNLINSLPLNMVCIP